MKIQHKTLKTLANGIPTPFTRVSSFKITRQTSLYAFICFANFPYSVSRSLIPGTIYFIGFAVIFDCSKPAAFQQYPPNYLQMLYLKNSQKNPCEYFCNKYNLTSRSPCSYRSKRFQYTILRIVLSVTLYPAFFMISETKDALSKVQLNILKIFLPLLQ